MWSTTEEVLGVWHFTKKTNNHAEFFQCFSWESCEHPPQERPESPLGGCEEGHGTLVLGRWDCVRPLGLGPIASSETSVKSTALAGPVPQATAMQHSFLDVCLALSQKGPDPCCKEVQT